MLSASVALRLVTGYRETVQRKFAKRAVKTPEQIRVVQRIVDALLSIEADIRHPKAQTEPAMVLPGDFSMDEMERAMAMIEEQEGNPFEV